MIQHNTHFQILKSQKIDNERVENSSIGNIY